MSTFSERKNLNDYIISYNNTPTVNPLILPLENDAKLYIRMLKNSINKFENTDTRNQIIDCIKLCVQQGYVENYDFFHLDKQHSKALLEIINYIGIMANHLPAYIEIILDKPFTLSNVEVNQFNNFLCSTINDIGIGDLVIENFNSWNNTSYHQLTSKELSRLCSLNFDILPMQTKIILQCFFNDIHFTSHLKEAISTGEISKLYLSNLKEILSEFRNPHHDAQLLHKKLYKTLHLISTNLRNEEQFYEAYYDGKDNLKLNIKGYNLFVKAHELTQKISPHNPNLIFIELSTYYELYIEINHESIELHFDCVLKCQLFFDIWTKISEQTKINKFELLFNPKFNCLFDANSLQEVSKILNSNVQDLDPSLAKYFDRQTEQFKLLQEIKKSSDSKEYKEHLENMENSFQSCQTSLHLPISPDVSIAKKRKFDHESRSL